MREMFQYNWQIRDEWFSWCKKIPYEDLTKKRPGGMGSILHNLYHVIDCEQIWVNQMNGTEVLVRDKNTITELEEVIKFSKVTKQLTEGFLKTWNPKSTLERTTKSGETFIFTHEKIMRHIMAHEIHHIGQLSVWAREMDRKPISSDILFRTIS